MSQKGRKILEKNFSEAYEKSEHNDYRTAEMTVKDKMALLESLGRSDLVELFKDWQPRKTVSKRTSPPLDQRVSIVVSSEQKLSLERALSTLRREGQTISMAEYIRNACISTIDIHEWREIAEKALDELDYAGEHKKELERKRIELAAELEEKDFEELEEYGDIVGELDDINRMLSRLIATPTRRSHRLSGRMSMAESQVVKWRAGRLCLSVSDYLRMLVFSLKPNSSADAHLSLAAKKRFYASIIDVSESGWGNPPEIYECSNCQNYIEEIARLRKEIEILRNI